jgi:hypothetical protein
VPRAYWWREASRHRHRVCVAWVSGCAGGARHDARHPARAALKAPVALISTPGWAFAGRAAVPEPRRLCPARVAADAAARLDGELRCADALLPGRAVRDRVLDLSESGPGGRAHRPPILGTPSFSAAVSGVWTRARSGIVSAAADRVWVSHVGGSPRRALADPERLRRRAGAERPCHVSWRDGAGDHAVGVHVSEPLMDAVVICACSADHARCGVVRRSTALVSARRAWPGVRLGR